MNKQEIYLAAGCFWGVQDFLDNLEGVEQTEVGYTGGSKKNPSYAEVCANSTGHAESVRVIYDSDVISTEDLLTEFFLHHDPTTLNRQGPDIGSQYRSEIFYTITDQKAAAAVVIIKLEMNHIFPQKIITAITPAGPFYRAEEYHQKYFKKNSGKGCHTAFF